VTVGISGDSCAAVSIAAGCDAWYSVIGGIFPHTARALLTAAQAQDTSDAMQMSEALAPLWELFTKYRGSLRVVAAAASLLGIVKAPALPLPLQPIHTDDVNLLASLIDRLQLK